MAGSNMKPQPQPMLSAKFDLSEPGILGAQLAKLTYPVICSPKIDGYRLINDPTLGPVTRTYKSIPNVFVRQVLHGVHYFEFDGELVVGEPHVTGDGTDVFHRSTCVMARDGTPDFTYWVFDDLSNPDSPYHQRLECLHQRLNGDDRDLISHRVRFLPYRVLTNPQEVFDYEEECLLQGYEGIMVRSPSAPYKYGRSTLKQQGLIKLKRTCDDDAVIIGYEPRYRNDNEQQLDNFGRAKRSTHQENKVALEMLGKFIVRSSKFVDTFSIGSGFDHSSASLWWKERDTLIGKIITYKYQECGTIDRPRHPIYLRFRLD